MSWKFKVSKYKNAAPRFPKKEESIADLPNGLLMQTCGNHITASSKFIAFDNGGGTLGVLPLGFTGRVKTSLPILKAHADYVTDLKFSPFASDVISTCAADATVKVWKLPDAERLSEDLNTAVPVCSLPAWDRRVETLEWNPVAEHVISVACGPNIKVYDITNEAAEISDIPGHGDQVLSVCWRSNGITMVTSCKDKLVRVLDPRSRSAVQEVVGHENNKDCRVQWMGDTDLVLTTGFSKNREREIKLWDTRNFSSALKTDIVDSNNGVLMPLYDEDTNMLLAIGKADTSWSYYEVSTADPYLTRNAVERTERSEQIRGACLVPKLAMNVMEGEVDRLMLLMQNSIVPLPYIVPRKDYRQFHADLFPDTKCEEPALSAQQWAAGENGKVSLTSLDPSKRSLKPQSQKPKDKEIKPNKEATKNEQPKSTDALSPSVPQSTASTRSQVTKATGASKETAKPAVVAPTEPSKAAKTFAAMHMSKCKYLKGVTEHVSKHIVNVRNLCRTLPGQSDLFAGNGTRCALPIEGPGGRVAVLELNQPGRLPDTGVPVLQNGSKVNDFVFDPFDDSRLLVGCDNAKVYIWKIHDTGLTETLDDYESYLMSHTEKIYFVRFHPLAKDVVVTGAYDMKLKIWDLTDNTEQLEVTCHTDEIFCAEWSPDGRYLATVCKDGRVRIIDPRKQSVREGKGPEGSRGARVIWAVDMTYLVVSGFDRDSRRQLLVYSVGKLGDPLYEETLDVSPSILVPHYDEGTRTVFLTGRGDASIITYEVSEEYPHLFALTPVKPEGAHQGIYFLPVTSCSVRDVEIARAWRLTQSSVEPMSFTVPRVKTIYFQDDLFPDTIPPSVPSMTSQEWFRGENKMNKKISLRPKDMRPLSEAPEEAPKARKYDSYNPDTYKTDEQKKEELISAMTNKLDIKAEPLPQDDAEGVDSDEWGDD